MKQLVMLIILLAMPVHAENKYPLEMKIGYCAALAEMTGRIIERDRLINTVMEDGLELSQQKADFLVGSGEAKGFVAGASIHSEMNSNELARSLYEKSHCFELVVVDD